MKEIIPTPIGRSFVIRLPEKEDELSELETSEVENIFEVIRTNECTQIKVGDTVELKPNAAPVIVSKKYLVCYEHEAIAIINR